MNALKAPVRTVDKVRDAVQPARRRRGVEPDLEVVERRRWWQRISWLEVVAGFVLVAVVWVALSVHVRMIDAQAELDQIQRQVRQARAEREELRRAESQLTSPEEVIAIATGELGMVPAAIPEFVDPLSQVIHPMDIPEAPPEAPGPQAEAGPQAEVGP